MPRKKGKHRKPTSKAIPFAKGVLRDKADRLWSVAVRDNWEWKCAVCGRSKTEAKLDAHHLIPRQHEPLRYTTRNGIGLCVNHHQFDPDLSPHQSPGGWMRWLAKHQPELHQWYTDTLLDPGYKTLLRPFGGTTNATYFIGVIRELKQHVSDENYERILKKKFAKWLADNA